MFNHFSEVLVCLFDEERLVKKVQAITVGILISGSCRVREVVRTRSGNETADYKCIQQFVAKTNMKASLLRMYQEESSFLIGDPTEMSRPLGAKKRAARLLQIPYTEHLTRLKSVKDTRSLYRPI